MNNDVVNAGTEHGLARAKRENKPMNVYLMTETIRQEIECGIYGDPQTRLTVFVRDQNEPAPDQAALFRICYPDGRTETV